MIRERHYVTILLTSRFRTGFNRPSSSKTVERTNSVWGRPWWAVAGGRAACAPESPRWRGIRSPRRVTCLPPGFCFCPR